MFLLSGVDRYVATLPMGNDCRAMAFFVGGRLRRASVPM